MRKPSKSLNFFIRKEYYITEMVHIACCKIVSLGI